MELSEINVKDIVKVHPASDLWMRGVKYITVTKVGRKYIYGTDTLGRWSGRVHPQNLVKEGSI